jgi:DHA2 family multidrug resistance protein
MGLIFVTLSTLAYDTLPREFAAEAAGLFNLTRTVGSSIGISVIATVLTNRTQFHWQELGGYINPFNPNLQTWLNAHGMSLSNPVTAHQLANTLDRQAGMLAFIDAFWFVTISFLMMLPLVLLLRRPIHHADAAAIGH